jgi:hypothetical protein
MHEFRPTGRRPVVRRRRVRLLGPALDRSGAVTKSTRLDHRDAEPSSSSDVNLGPVTDDGEEIDVPTLSGLLALVQTASDDGGETTRTFDAQDGHPLKVTFNTSDTGAAAATECFAVTDYKVG